MSSFFEKLKKGMGVEEIKEEQPKEEQPKEAPPEKTPPKAKPKKTKPAREPKEVKEVVGIKKIKIEELPAQAELESKTEPEKQITGESKKVGFDEPQGELAVDIYQTENDLVVQAAIAGVKPADLEISMERDMISIKGKRARPSEEKGDYFVKECFWGPFSKKIIAPVEVDPNLIEAAMREGILTIRIPKILREKKRKIEVKS